MNFWYFLLYLKDLYTGLSLPKFVLVIDFHWNLKNIFPYLNNFPKFLIKGAKKKNGKKKSAKFSIDYTYHIKVLWLIKWILSKKLLHSVTNYNSDNRILCGHQSDVVNLLFWRDLGIHCSILGRFIISFRNRKDWFNEVWTRYYFCLLSEKFSSFFTFLMWTVFVLTIH